MGVGLNVEQIGALVTVEVSNGPDNEFTKEMCLELTDLLMRPPHEAKVLLLSASGESFCNGRDRSGQSASEIRSMALALAEVNIALIYSRLAVVAKVSGDAKGFGVGLAGLADVAIAVEGARFCFPEVNSGFAPALVLAWLPYVIGRRESFRMASTGATLTAREAQRLGLLNEVVSAGDLDERVNAVVSSLLAVPESVGAHIKSDLLVQDWLAMKEDSYAAVERLSLRTVMLTEKRALIS